MRTHRLAPGPEQLPLLELPELYPPLEDATFPDPNQGAIDARPDSEVRAQLPASDTPGGVTDNRLAARQAAHHNYRVGYGLTGYSEPSAERAEINRRGRALADSALRAARERAQQRS